MTICFRRSQEKLINFGFIRPFTPRELFLALESQRKLTPHFVRSSPVISVAEYIPTETAAHPIGIDMATTSTTIALGGVPKATSDSTSDYQDYVNPQWVTLLNLLGMNVEYERCLGCELFTKDGRRILDFLSGYCVHNAGHNHPDIIQALKDEMDRCGPAMLQSHVPKIAGELARRLCELAGGESAKSLFRQQWQRRRGSDNQVCPSRNRPRRDCLCPKQFSWADSWRALADERRILARRIRPPVAGHPGRAVRRHCGIGIVRWQANGRPRLSSNPSRLRAEFRCPRRAYLQQAQEACRRTGTLFVLDEVQTGMYRTGTFLAAHHFDVQPDMVVLAKALSGGLIPVSAVLMKNKIYQAVYSSLRRAIVHTSTFSENSLSMRAGLATLDVLEREELGRRALHLGEEFRGKLRRELAGFDIVKDVRGMGLLNGIEFAPPKKLAFRALYEAFSKIHPAMFGQVLVMRMFRERNMLTQICGNNFMVLKAAPPLTVTAGQLDEFVAGIR